ncbi:MAG: DUF2877 domain-containing protein [Candidatus Ozemobacteraceae bacterium]
MFSLTLTHHAKTGFIRPDSWLTSAEAGAGRISGVFKQSLAVTIGGTLLNLHTLSEAIHPLGILLPDPSFLRLSPGTPAAFFFPELRLGDEQLILRSDPNLVSGVSLGADFFSNRNEFITGLQKMLTRLECMLKSLGKHSEVGSAYLFGNIRASFSPALSPPQSFSPAFRRGKKVGSASSAGMCSAVSQTPDVLLSRLLAEGIGRALQDLRDGCVALIDLLRFFGGGEGLTPAFDDFCTGLLLADTALFSIAGECRNRVFADEAFFDALRPRTTLPAWWQLRCAAQGKSSLMIERYIAKLVHAQVSASDILRIIAIGHTSGTDILCGVHARLQREMS